MPRDGELYPHISDPKCRALAIRGHNETVAELIEAGKERFVAAIAEALDAIEELEGSANIALLQERGFLEDVASGVRGVTTP